MTPEQAEKILRLLYEIKIMGFAICLMVSYLVAYNVLSRGK